MTTPAVPLLAQRAWGIAAVALVVLSVLPTLFVLLLAATVDEQYGWLLIPAFGGIPYLLADEPQLANPMDAYFEAVSGFTATGATTLTDIEALDRSLLLWRQFTQWLGGMGIVVLAIAVLPRLRIGGRQLLQSELAGPTEMERLTATIRENAKSAIWPTRSIGALNGPGFNRDRLSFA